MAMTTYFVVYTLTVMWNLWRTELLWDNFNQSSPISQANNFANLCIIQKIVLLISHFYSEVSASNIYF
jgi:hypothetical protein